MSRFIKLTVVLAVVLSLVIAGTALAAKGGNPDKPGGGKGGPPDNESTNNLSFPVIATDGFTIVPLAAATFTTEWDLSQYDPDGDGIYEELMGLTVAEIDALQPPAGPWYAQKVEGNVWQAEFAEADTVAVDYVDWSDSMETVYPKVGIPFRLEVVLFKNIVDEVGAPSTMTAYTMKTLAYPSSKDETKGTDKSQYESSYATVISGQPKLVVQYIGAEVPTLTWNPATSRWVRDDGSVPAVDQVAFAVELNVSGKYIWGASTKGWRPSQTGFYRVTFYEPPAFSGVDITDGTITADEALGFAPSSGTAAVGVLDAANNLAYIDLEAGGEGDPGGGEEGE